MTTLRQKMIEGMQLHGIAERTQDAYLRVVRQLATYYNKPPDRINEAELRQYFLYLKNDKKAARSTITLALCGIKFFYEHTLQQKCPENSGVSEAAAEPTDISPVPKMCCPCCGQPLLFQCIIQPGGVFYRSGFDPP